MGWWRLERPCREDWSMRGGLPRSGVRGRGGRVCDLEAACANESNGINRE